MGRAVAQTIRCSGCHRILVENLWMPERREYHVKYRVSLCPQCVLIGGPHPLPGEGEIRSPRTFGSGANLETGR